MSAGHGDTAEQMTSVVVAQEHRPGWEHKLLQPWLVLAFPTGTALPWGAGLSSSAEALPAKPSAQGNKHASLVLGYFFAHFRKL